MWLSKFLDFEEDLKKLRTIIKKDIFKGIKKAKLTPLEFTILEHIFNNKEISGYSLILNLNKHFAGTWEAQSGTIYPILSKLTENGFLKSKTIKSPIGPLRTLYSLTEAGENILKMKVNNNFLAQIKFIENFLIELSKIYIDSFPEEDRKEKIGVIQNLLDDSLHEVKEFLDSAFKAVHSISKFKTICPECKAELDREGASFCPYCGANILSEQKNAKDNGEPSESIETKSID